MKYSSPEAYQLLHDGVRALSLVESNGIRIDVDYLNKSMEETAESIQQLQKKMSSSEVGRVWRREYGLKANYGSSEQLARVLFEVLKHDPPERTASGKYKTDIAAIEKVDDPFVKDYMQCEKLKKTRNTFLKGILRETINGYAHVNFNLSTAATYRSSSSNFNFQNLPIRDPVQGGVIRRCFIPREGRRIIEIDYSGIEVCIAACYHKDPSMITYLTDKSKDMHRDMAALCYGIRPEQVTKQARYGGKNMFVFPQFYGDYYLNCARSLWEWMERNQLKTEDGSLLLKDALKKKGVMSKGLCEPGQPAKPGTFESHIKEVERQFWDKKFPVYRDWKRKWYNAYLRSGYFVTKTGFRIEGNFGRNDVINYPVQGSAFHCLLWSLIQIQRALRAYKMKTLIVGQIHDSIVADVPEEETEQYLELCHDIMTKQLLEHWSWINIPLETEAEMTPVGGSWAEKKAIK